MNCKIDCKRVAIASVVCFFLFNVFEYLVHGVLLMAKYQSPEYAALWNPQAVMRQRQLVGLLAYMIVIPLFCRVYAQGHENDKWGAIQGVKYGLMAGAMISVYHGLISYMVYPVGIELALAWVFAGIAEFAALGAVTGVIYRNRSLDPGV